jgi:deoxyhypusine synthase
MGESIQRELDYTFYITADQEFDGSLSGALVMEVVLLGRVTLQARQAALYAEVTTILPFIYAALLLKLRK